MRFLLGKEYIILELTFRAMNRPVICEQKLWALFILSGATVLGLSNSKRKLGLKDFVCWKLRNAVLGLCVVEGGYWVYNLRRLWLSAISIWE